MSMTGITNATIIPKDGRMSRMMAPRSALKPFVVCSMATRRYAEHKTSKMPVSRLSPTAGPTSSRDGPHIPDEALTKQTYRPGQVRSVVSTTVKTEVRRSSTQPASPPEPGNTTRSKKSAASSRLASKGRSLSENMISSEPIKVVERSKGEKTTQSRLAPANPQQLTTASEAPPRPSCVPRGHFPRSFVADSKGRQEVIVKAVIPRPRNPGIKACTDVLTTWAGTHVMDTGSSVTKLSVNEPRLGVRSGQNEAPALRNQVMDPPVDWSSPTSPDLSSFPPQSLIVAGGVDVKEAKSMAGVCGDEAPTNIHDAERSSSADMANDSYGSPGSVVTSPALSSSSTVVSTPLTCASGVDKIKTSCGRKDLKVSPADCDAKIISQSRNGATSTNTIVGMMERGQADSPTKNSDSGSGAQTTVQSAFEIARNLFSGSQHVSQATHGTTALKTTGTDVSRLRSLFVPPLDKDTKASQNAMIQLEIEMLRTRKKVAGGGVVNPRLERLGSLSAIAIALKHSTPSSARI